MNCACFAGVVAVVAAAGTSFAQVTVFEQAVDPAFGNAFISDEAGGFFDQRVGDNFTVFGPNTTLTGATWTGFEEGFFSVDFPGNIDGFSVEIFDDSAGLPGASIFSEDFLLGDLTVSDVGLDPINSREIKEFSADFSSGVSITAGDQYWFSVNIISVNGTANDDSFFWSSSLAGDGLNAIETPVGSGLWGADVNDVAFSIRAIPSPGATCLAGLAGLAAMRRRR